MGLLRFLSAPPTAKAAALPVRSAPLVTSIDEMPAHIRAKALEKARYVELVVKLAAGMGAKKAAEKIAELHGDELPLLKTGGKNGASQLTYHNYRNWRRLIRGVKDQELRLVALADKYVRGCQQSDNNEDFWQALHAIWLGGRDVPVTVAYRHACKVALQKDPKADLPSIHQARYRLNKIDPELLVLGKKGETAFHAACADYIDRDWSQVYPGQCLVGDTRTFDTRVRVWDDKSQRWVAVRPNVVGLLDAASWYLPAYWITTEPVCADTVIDTLRGYLAVNNCRPPAQCYFDNGSDYCAQGFAKDMIIEGRPHSIFRELGIELRNSLPYNARAKTIEPFFKGMMLEFDKLFPDYLGSDPSRRTMDASWFDRHPEELPTLEQLTLVFADFIRDYHRTPKHGAIHQGRSPQEIWDARPDMPALTPERLKMAFLRPIGTRVVARGPAVRIEGKRYFCDCLKWGQKIMIKSESIDPETIHCFELDGSYIGPARTRDGVSALALYDDAQARERISELMARSRRQLKEAKSAMLDLTGGGHLLSILELAANDCPLDIQTTPKKRISSVKGQQHSYARSTLPDAFPPAVDTEPPKRPAALDLLRSAKVDRGLLKMVHGSRHAQEEKIDIEVEKLDLDCRAILADT